MMSLYLGLFLMQLDASIVNVGLHRIALDLGHTARLPWVVDAYLLPVAALMVAVGTLGDRYGYRSLYVGGLALFLAGSIACAVAPSLTWLIAARVAQGVGAAPLAPMSLALLVRANDGMAQRTIARWAAIGGLGYASGPVLGGGLVTWFGWRSVFAVTALVALLTLLAARTIRDDHARNPQPLDVAGLLLASAALTAMVTALIEGPHRGWFSPVTVGALLVAVGCAAGFGVVEGRSDRPMLPPRVARTGGLPWLLLATMLMTFGAFGFFYALSLHLQVDRGLPPGRTGLVILPMTLSLVAGSSLAHHLTNRIGPSRAAMAAFSLAMLSLGVLWLAGDGIAPVSLAAVFVAFGLATGMQLSALAILGARALPPEDAGLASALFNCARQGGAAFGAALLGSIYGAGGWPRYAWVLVLAIGASAVAIGALAMRSRAIARPAVGGPG